MSVYALAVCGPCTVLHMACSGTAEEGSALCVLLSPVSQNESAREKKATHCCIWVNHGVDPSLALLARRSNHFRPPTLELPRLRTLGRDGQPAFELVERQLLHQLCPRIGRRFELPDQVFAISIVMEHLEVMRANKLVKISSSLLSSP